MSESNHKTVLDTGLQHLGAVYAKALVGAGESTGSTEALLAELQSFVSDVLDQLPKFEALLASPRVPYEAKEQLLDKTFRDRMNPLLLNFVKVLIRRGRFEAVRATQAAARRILNDRRGRVEVQLTTAEPVDAATVDLIVTRLTASLRREVDLATRIDPDLIGGMVIRVGDTVYDGSVANQLKQLKAELVTRAGQTMRVQADRFAVAQ